MYLCTKYWLIIRELNSVDVVSLKGKNKEVGIATTTLGGPLFCVGYMVWKV